MSASSLPSGQVSDLGGRPAHWAMIEGSRPPVLLLGGCGVPYTLWRPVTERLRGAEMILLDRPGMAGSPWPNRLPTLAEEIDTLVALGEQVGQAMITVAHSMAGPHAEAFARVRPDLVAGLVLVDASVEWQPKPSTHEVAWLRTARVVRKALQARPARAAAALADRAMVAAQSERTRFRFMPKDARSVYRDPDTVAQVIAEQAAYGRQLADLADLRVAHPWPGTPTVLLTATGDGGQDWVQTQQRYARLLGGEQIVLSDSRHLIMLDRPDAIADAVRALSDNRAR